MKWVESSRTQCFIISFCVHLPPACTHLLSPTSPSVHAIPVSWQEMKCILSCYILYFSTVISKLNPQETLINRIFETHGSPCVLLKHVIFLQLCIMGIVLYFQHKCFWRIHIQLCLVSICNKRGSKPAIAHKLAD